MAALLAVSVSSFAAEISLSPEEVSLPPEDIWKADLETGRELSRWIEEAREINPFYQPGADNFVRVPETKDTSAGLRNFRRVLAVYGMYSRPQEKDDWFDIDYYFSYGFSVMYKLSDHWEIGAGYAREQTEYLYWGGKRKMEKLFLFARWRPTGARWYIPFGAGISMDTSEYDAYLYDWPYTLVRCKGENDNPWGFIGLGWEIPLNQTISLGLEARYQLSQTEILENHSGYSSLQMLAALNIHF